MLSLAVRLALLGKGIFVCVFISHTIGENLQLYKRVQFLGGQPPPRDFRVCAVGGGTLSTRINTGFVDNLPLIITHLYGILRVTK